MQKKVQKAIESVKPTLVDRVVTWFDPAAGVKRRRARVALALANSYTGASRSRKSMSTWSTSAGDADADILFDLPALRERSRDLGRNNPIATGAGNIKNAQVIGGGLRLSANIDAEYLGLSEEQADAWERNTEREFNVFAESRNCDVTRMQNFYQQQSLGHRSMWDNGDVLVSLPYIERPGHPYSLAVQLIEADRISNENYVSDTDRLTGGVEKDAQGAPTRFHVSRRHPGSMKNYSNAWDKIEAYGTETGRRNAWLLFHKKRVGQTRGVPVLAPVIEALKQLGDYTEAELMAAVVSGLFTVFVHTEGDYSLSEIGEFQEKYGSSTAGELKMGSGSVIGLGVNEQVDIANPGRPNQAFDPFVRAILWQIGSAIETPFEVLMQVFNSSYSASKAALEQAWMFVRNDRKLIATDFCQPVYEAWMDEAVALGRVKAPGYFRDPAIRAAYLGAQWVGQAKPILDLSKEAGGRVIMEDRGWITASQNTIEMTGGDWERMHRQRAKEHRMRVEADLEPRIAVVEVEKEPDEDDTDEGETDDDTRQDV